MSEISRLLICILRMCYTGLENFLLAIILFTLLTKIILFPISLWTHRNSLAMMHLMPELNRLKIKFYGDKDAIAEETQLLYRREGYHPLLGTVPMFIQLGLLIGVIGAVRELLAGQESALSCYPSQEGGIMLFMPVAAGLSALVLGLAQNRLNPLQREQGKAGQWMTNGLSIGISLVLGAFVPVGVGFYWIASNLLTIIQQLVLNAVMRPEKYIDYGELEKSRRELGEMDSLSAHVSKEDKLREKADYKRFFSIANKHLVFYSEKSGFYKYFQDVIEYLLSHSNITIHYITSDPKDQIFALAETQPHIKPYYIGEQKLITLMMKMDADMVVMTVPDLDKYYLKRSYVRKDIEYVYMFHAPLSFIMTISDGALDHYDTIFCTGIHQVREIRESEKLYHLPEKRIVECGYGVIDNMAAHYQKNNKTYEHHEKKKILVAPSWHPDNILDSCLEPLIYSMSKRDWEVIIRPHPEYIKRYPGRIKEIQEQFAAYWGENLMLEMDFYSNETVYSSDILISDWSGITYEFSLSTLKPVIFINTKMKVANPNWNKLSLEPLMLSLRDEIGISLEKQDVRNIAETIDMLLSQREVYQERIAAVRSKYLFHFGESGRVAGKYILKQLTKKE